MITRSCRMRGLDIYCGCFSTDTTADPAGLWKIARNAGLLALAVYLMSVSILGRTS